MQQQNLSVINKINPSEILSDLKTIIGDFYVAKLDLNKEGLNLEFTGGQTFVISVKEKSMV